MTTRDVGVASPATARACRSRPRAGELYTSVGGRRRPARVGPAAPPPIRRTRPATRTRWSTPRAAASGCHRTGRAAAGWSRAAGATRCSTTSSGARSPTRRRVGGRTQIGYRDLGRARAHHLRARRASAATRDSRKPVIGNSGFYVTFESDATQPERRRRRPDGRPQRPARLVPVHRRARHHARAVGRGPGRAAAGRRPEPVDELLRELHRVRLAGAAGRGRRRTQMYLRWLGGSSR